VNSFFILFGIESWKPVLTALILPPVPLLLLILIGARLLLPRRGLGWVVIILSVALLWLSCCIGAGRALAQFALHEPPALTSNRIQELKTQGGSNTAIMVLGGGLEPYAPEYGVSSLQTLSLERLRYGIWLSRETGLPLGFSGGVGFGQSDSTAEARIAAHIAATEFNRPMKWVEDNSRDTRENALRSVALLKQTGVKHIVLVTNAWHMPRALRDFEAAAGAELTVEPAPMGLAQKTELPSLTWIPTLKGATQVREIVRELLGLLAGA
jgi:uncharacterized SAM-binding protein YcdF (DUF218 family)